MHEIALSTLRFGCSIDGILLLDRSVLMRSTESGRPCDGWLAVRIFFLDTKTHTQAVMKMLMRSVAYRFMFA